MIVRDGIRLDRLPLLLLVCLLGFIPLACDDSKGTDPTGEAIETNFGIGLAAVISAEGVPDSVLAIVHLDGVATDTLQLDLAKRTEAGVVRFPIEAPEGVKLLVVYRAYKNGHIVAMGQVSWVSGEAPFIPRPNLAPRISITGKENAIVRRGHSFVLSASSSDTEKALSSLMVDWNGDGTLDDSVVPPKGQDSIRIVWDKPGRYDIAAWVRDDQGMRRRDTLSVLVVPAAQIAMSRDTTVSVEDTVDALVSMGYDDPAQARTTNLFWSVDGDTSTAGMVPLRRLAWSEVGTHRVIVVARDQAGEASRDTMLVHVVQDAPKLDLGDFPRLVDLGSVATLPVGVEQSHGTIARWGMDFDADTSKGWDTTATGALASVQHLFGRPGQVKVLVFVVDDDSNRTVGSGTISVSTSNSGAVFQRDSRRDTTISIGDSMVVKFTRSFPEGFEVQSRVEWIDGSRRDTLPVAIERSFAWADPGKHAVAWRLISPLGSTGWDTISAQVVRDAPVLDLSGLPAEAGLNAPTTFSPLATQAFGSIVRWGMDFDGDTANGWDAVRQGKVGSLIHVFPRPDTAKVLVFVDDDDGNHVVGSRGVLVSNLGTDMLFRRSASVQKASIGDTVAIRFGENFPLGTRNQAKLVWRVDTLAPDTLAIDTVRKFSWSTSGSHVVASKVVAPYGATSWDTTRIEIVQDAPVVSFPANIDTVAVNDQTMLAISTTQDFGQFVSWAVDFDGDTTGRWDSSGTGAMPAQFAHAFPAEGGWLVRARVGDDDGNIATASRTVQARKGVYGLVQRAVSADTTVSIGDSVRARLRLGGALESQFATSRLEWKVDTTASETLAVSDVRGFRWDVPGNHVVRFRALGAFGVTGWDSVVFRIVQGEPRILSISRTGNGVGKTITFSVASDPVFGRIVRERWDFGDNGTWDDSTTIPGENTEHVFPTSVPASIRVQVTDDDGNSDDSVFTFAASNASPVFGTTGFTDPTVGLTLPIRLRTSFTDPDGNADLSSLSVDWNDDGVWDTTRNVGGLAGEEFVRAFASAGDKLVRLRLVDNSGAVVFDTAKIVVTKDAPKLDPLHPLGGGTVARIGDTLWFVAPISDPSNPADLDSATWIRDGMNDTTVSLRGSSVIDMKVPVFSRIVGQHLLKVVVKDRVGSKDSASATWSVVAAPPFARSRMSDVFLTSRDTAHLILDSLRPGSMGGRIKSVSWAFKGSNAWNPVPVPEEGMQVAMRIPHLRDSLWHVVVKTVQDNGEVRYDTARSDILNSFVDPRDGKIYPVVEAGGLEWLGRNLNFNSTDSRVQSSCAKENCAELGVQYTKPVPLDGQFVPKDSSIVVSVCPDGWRLPTEADFDSMVADGFRRGGWRNASMLRSRFGWTEPVTPQDDPLRFGGRSTSGYGSSEQTSWWTYDPEPLSELWRYTRETLDEALNSNGAGDNQARYVVRCVRLKDFVVASNESHLNMRVDTGTVYSISNHAYTPDSSASVRIVVSLQDQSIVSNAIPSKFRLTNVVTTIPRPVRLGRAPLIRELEQNGVVWKETLNVVVKAERSDSRPGAISTSITKIGNQLWTIDDVNFNGVGEAVATTEPYSRGRHYEIDSMFLGAAPENGPATPIRGICPEGMHIPSKTEWEVLFDAVRADGLDPIDALRDETRYTAEFWTSGRTGGTNDYSFGAYPTGYYDNGTWTDGAFYIAAGSDGYSFVNFDTNNSSPDILGPVAKSDVAGKAFAVRCVGD